jgi:hypothetical protein
MCVSDAVGKVSVSGEAGSGGGGGVVLDKCNFRMHVCLIVWTWMWLWLQALASGRDVERMKIRILYRCGFLCVVGICYFHVQKSTSTPPTFVFRHVFVGMEN